MRPRWGDVPHAMWREGTSVEDSRAELGSGLAQGPPSPERSPSESLQRKVSWKQKPAQHRRPGETPGKGPQPGPRQLRAGSHCLTGTQIFPTSSSDVTSLMRSAWLFPGGTDEELLHLAAESHRVETLRLLRPFLYWAFSCPWHLLALSSVASVLFVVQL